jgi:hypothetical protein
MSAFGMCKKKGRASKRPCLFYRGAALSGDIDVHITAQIFVRLFTLEVGKEKINEGYKRVKWG